MNQRAKEKPSPKKVMKTDISFYIFTSHKKKGSSYMLKAVQKVKGKGFIDHLYLFICFNTKT